MIHSHYIWGHIQKPISQPALLRFPLVPLDHPQRTPPLRGAKRRTIQLVLQRLSREAGLLRCARNDAGGAVSQITCPAQSEKICCFLSDAKHLPYCTVSSHRGALAIVTDAGRDAMDAIRHR